MSKLDDLIAELEAYKKCRDAILGGAQSYTIAGRSLTRADLRIIIEHIKELEMRISRLRRQALGSIIYPVFKNQR